MAQLPGRATAIRMTSHTSGNDSVPPTGLRPWWPTGQRAAAALRDRVGDGSVADRPFSALIGAMTGLTLAAIGVIKLFGTATAPE